MLALISQRGECSASDLGEPFEIAQPSVSKHIRVLERAGLVARRVDGRVHRFRLVSAPLKEAQDWLVRHQQFWEGTLDSLGSLVDSMTEETEK
jgi:DNA-binding transcriptional ArsR family regulator